MFRAFALSVVTFLILASAYFLIFEGYDDLTYYLDNLFNEDYEIYSFSDLFDLEIYLVIFRLCFIYILIASIYRFVRSENLFGMIYQNGTISSAQWDKFGMRLWYICLHIHCSI